VSALAKIWRRVVKKKTVVIPLTLATVCLLIMTLYVSIFSLRKSATIKARLKRARELIAQEKYQQARDELIGILERDEQNTEAHTLLDSVQQKLDQLAALSEARQKEQQRQLQLAEKREQALSMVLNGRGMVAKAISYLYRRGSLEPMHHQLNQALQVLDKALKLCPDLSAAWEAKGRAYEYLFQPQKAMYCYEQALKFDPENVFALSGKGSLLLQKMENMLLSWGPSEKEKTQEADNLRKEALHHLRKVLSLSKKLHGTVDEERKMELDFAAGMTLWAEQNYTKLLEHCNEKLSIHGESKLGGEKFLWLLAKSGCPNVLRPEKTSCGDSHQSDKDVTKLRPRILLPRLPAPPLQRSPRSTH
jgi:tetratricopeptide (TPR) repeat protein